MQQLLVAKALDHALQKATLDVEGAKIFIDVNSQMRFQNPYFEKAFEHWFLKKGALLTEEKEKADYIASIIVKSAGTNGSQFGLGLPAMSVPLTSISTPQLAIFSGYNQKGYAEIEMILYSQEIGLKEITGPLVGETFYKEYTIIFIPISSQNIY